MAVLASLAIVCAARPLLVLLADAARRRGWERRSRAQGRPRGRRRGARRRRRLRRSADRRREPCPLERRGDGAPRSATGELSTSPSSRRRGSRRSTGIRSADRAGSGRRSRERVGGAPGPRPHARDGWRGRRPAWRRCGGRSRRRAARQTFLVRGRAHPRRPSSAATARLRRRRCARVGNGDTRRGRRPGRAPLPRPSSSC